MTDRANIKLPVDEFEKHNERRQELGLSWSEYIDGQAPDAPDVEIGEEVKEQLDRIEESARAGEVRSEQIQETLVDVRSAASTAEERAGTIERKVDELSGR